MRRGVNRTSDDRWASRGFARNLRRGRFAALAVACVLVVGAATATPAGAQTLDLDGTRAGPAIPAENGAVELLRVLDVEKRDLDAQAARLAGEARVGAEAKAKLRQIAVMLLQTGAARPWSQSAPVVFGLRIANMLARADRAVDAATKGTRVGDGAALPPSDARAAIEALQRFALGDIEAVRAASAANDARPESIAKALARVLSPLATAVEIAERAKLADAWPVLASSAASAQAQAARRADAAALAAAVDALAAGPTRDTARAVLGAATKDAIPDLVLLRALAAACDAIAWTASMRAAPKPHAIDDAALDAIDARVGSALGQLAGAADGAAPDAAARLEALAPSLAAARAMLAMRGASWMNDAGRRALAEACVSLCAADLPSGASERNRARTAERIAEACAAADELARGEAADAPRDLKDVLKLLDRDARFAVRALPEAFASMTRDPARSADPAALSALTRVTGLAADRNRIAAMQDLIDRIAGVQPKSGRAFAAIAKRLSRMLLDPIKRSDAQVAFVAIESQAASALPFAFEDELKRQTDRALALTGGNATRVVGVAAAIRVAWTEAIGTGNLGGPASKRLDLAARYFAAMRDVAQLSAPITREQGDRLSTWGGFAARRALLAPAATDLDARTLLASRSFMAMGATGDTTSFARDLEALEQGLPLVRLVARLERTLGPQLTADPTTTASMLAALVQAPPSGAALARSWSKLNTLDRALLESESARRSGDMAARAALAKFMADLAEDIETAAFGARPTIGAVPGFDGSAPDETPAGKKRSGEKGR